MLINTKVEVGLNASNIRHFKSKGYDIKKGNKTVIVNAKDLKERQK